MRVDAQGIRGQRELCLAARTSAVSARPAYGPLALARSLHSRAYVRRSRSNVRARVCVRALPFSAALTVPLSAFAFRWGGFNFFMAGSGIFILGNDFMVR